MNLLDLCQVEPQSPLQSHYQFVLVPWHVHDAVERMAVVAQEKVADFMGHHVPEDDRDRRSGSVLRSSRSQLPHSVEEDPGDSGLGNGGAEDLAGEPRPLSHPARQDGHSHGRGLRGVWAAGMLRGSL